MKFCDGAVSVRGMKFMARHGVFQDERALPQPFEVDVEVRGDFSRAMRTDELDDSYDYRHIVDSVRTVMEGNSISLIERIAAEILEKVSRNAPYGSLVTVRVRKPAAPLDVPFDTVEFELQTRVE